MSLRGTNSGDSGRRLFLSRAGSEDSASVRSSNDDLKQQQSMRNTTVGIFVDVEDVYRDSIRASRKNQEVFISGEQPVVITKNNSSSNVRRAEDPTRTSNMTADDSVTLDPIVGTEEDFKGYAEFQFDSEKRKGIAGEEKDDVADEKSRTITLGTRVISSNGGKAAHTKTSSASSASVTRTASNTRTARTLPIDERLELDETLLTHVLVEYLKKHQPRAIKDGRLKSLMNWARIRGVRKLRLALKEEYGQDSSSDLFVVAEEYLKGKEAVRASEESSAVSAVSATVPPRYLKFGFGSFRIFGRGAQQRSAPVT